MSRPKKYTIEEIIRELEKQDVGFYGIGNFVIHPDSIIHGLKYSFADNRQYLRELRDLKGLRLYVKDYLRRDRTFFLDSDMADENDIELITKVTQPGYYPWDLEGVFGDVSLKDVDEYFDKSKEIKEKRAIYKRCINISKKINKLK